jgi:dihydrofolate reductase
MKLSLIVAVSRNGVIGKDGGLPWPKIPEDIANFRRLTMGHAVIMGRKTFDSLGEALRGRKNIILSRNRFLDNDEYFSLLQILIARTPAEAIHEAFDAHGTTDAFVIGGESLYRQFAPICDEMHITTVDRDVEGDARFDAAWAAPRGQWAFQFGKVIAPEVIYEHWTRTG